MKYNIISLTLLSMSILVGCSTNPHDAVLDEDGASQLRRRQIQTRYFDTSDKTKTLEAVMDTLQDLGFIIDKADYDIGSVTGTKLKGYALRITVNVSPRGKEQMTVRANAQYNITPVDDPGPYQSFFDALSKSLFLKAHLEE